MKWGGEVNENRSSVFSHPSGVSDIKNLFSFTPGVSENGGANENITPGFLGICCAVKRFQSHPYQYAPGGLTEIRNFYFQSPPPPQWCTGFDFNRPLLVMANWIAVLVMVTDCKG